jgi:hypothetical protein
MPALMAAVLPWKLPSRARLQIELSWGFRMRTENGAAPA